MRSKPGPESEGNPSSSGRRASTVQSTWVALSLDCTRCYIPALLICSRWQCTHLQEHPNRAFSKIHHLTNHLLDHHTFTPSDTHLSTYRTRKGYRPHNDKNAAAVIHPLLRRNLEVPRPHRANHPHRSRHHPLHRPRHNPEPARDKIQHRRYHHGTSSCFLPGNITLNACGTVHLEPRDLTNKTGHQIPRRHRLPTPDRAPRALPQVGQHESECHPKQRGNRVLACCAGRHWDGSREGEWSCCGAECAHADSCDCVGVS